MGYIENIENQSRAYRPTGFDIGLPQGQAYASYYPQWETQTPQYQQPNPYATTQAAFRTNEFVYSIIIKRAMAEAKGRFRVNTAGDDAQEIKKHGLTSLIRHPNKNMTENDFWGIKRISQDLAGFAAFEIEYNLLGMPLRLWFMRPDWCSFIRGQQDPLKYIRYQPYGLAPMDIPLVDERGRQKVLFFSNAEDFDPLYPGVRFFSPAMHAMGMIQIDNAMTFFLSDFVRNGARPAGLLSVESVIDQNIADDYARRWKENHGGAENWAQPIILGLGTKYSTLQMNFRDMMFGELDARNESRICNTFQMETIVADARAGLDVSSYNNKKEATKNWYYNWVVDTWDTNAEVMNTQMLPAYEDNPDDFLCDFDTSKVYIMQEDRSERFKRAQGVWKDRMVKLNVALKEAGLDTIDGPEGDSYYEAVSVKSDQIVSAEGETGASTSPGLATRAPVKVLPASEEEPAEGDTPPVGAKALEAKAFKKFAANRLQAGKPYAVIEFEFKHHSTDEVQFLIMQAGIIPGASQVIETMRAVLEKS